MMRAVTALVLESPFFGSLALRLRLQADSSCDTAWTDGAAIGFNPEFVASLRHDELTALVAHEVMHVAAGHPWRIGGRDAKRWNKAADYAINGELQAAGFQLPAGGLLDAQYTGKGAEWVYDRLPAEQDDGAGSGSGSGSSDAPAGEVRPAPAPSQDPDAPSQADWQQAVQQAANVAKARGELPGGLERFAADAAAPSVDWRSVLQRFVQQAARADYTWTRPSARYLPRGLYLPSLQSHELGPIAVGIDVSGSVDDVLLAQFSAELQTILDDARPSELRVIYCDARVQRRETYVAGDRVELRACGGGGTDFRPVFDALEADDDAPVALVYLTDLYGTFPTDAPEFPVLWAATSRQTAPWGETVRVG